jgi:hypothetical protein
MDFVRIGFPLWIIPLIILVIVLVIIVLNWEYRRSFEILGKWAERNGYRIIKAERRYSELAKAMPINGPW